MTTPSRYASPRICAIAALCLLTTGVEAATESEQCILDLEAIPAFLLAFAPHRAPDPAQL
jgi:hypothetical protein